MTIRGARRAGMPEDEPWAIELGEEFVFNRPGEGAREVEAELAEGKSGARRALERMLDVRSAERNWRRGAVGEEEVGRRLDRLPTDRWAVVHDLTIGVKGANLDHLVIGPPGVFTLNTKHLSGKVTVYDRALLVNGRTTDYYVKSLAEARKVQDRLASALGREVVVWGVIVLMGCELDLRKRPADLSVIGRRQVPGWFEKQPGQRLRPGDVLEIERAARSPSTWMPGTTRKARQDRAPAEPPVMSEPSVAHPPAGGTAPPPPSADGPPPPSASDLVEVELTVRRWRRYGHDRLYGRLSDGTTVGWIDVETGRLEVEPGHDEGVVGRQLERARRGVIGQAGQHPR